MAIRRDQHLGEFGQRIHVEKAQVGRAFLEQSHTQPHGFVGIVFANIGVLGPGQRLIEITSELRTQIRRQKIGQKR